MVKIHFIHVWCFQKINETLFKENKQMGDSICGSCGYPAC